MLELTASTAVVLLQINVIPGFVNTSSALAWFLLDTLGQHSGERKGHHFFKSSNPKMTPLEHP